MENKHSSGGLNPRIILLSVVICAIAAVAAPYITLKLGLGIDLTMGGMFVAAAVLGRKARGSAFAVELNMIQTMVSASTGVAFMVVILAAFYYVQNVFGHDIGFNPTWWQLSVWLFVSSSLGLFLGALLRDTVLQDSSLPWPTGRVAKSVIDTLSDVRESAEVAAKRTWLAGSTVVASLLTLLRDKTSYLPYKDLYAPLNIAIGVEPAIIGLGMVVPLSVGLSGLIGVAIIWQYGETLAMYAALAGTAAEHWDACVAAVSANQVTDFVTNTCGDGAKFVNAPSHFRYLVQWTMWPATAMMIAAALVSVLVPLVKYQLSPGSRDVGAPESIADERISKRHMWIGLVVSVVLLMWLQHAWFAMPPEQVLLAVGLQPVLVVAGLRVLGLTGQGPVSLMANATQFVFGLIWPSHIQQNLNAAHISADPQASSEGTVSAFWVARRVGGSFSALIVGQFIAVAVAALLIPITFTMLVNEYGVGLEDGQLSAPTALKIASLAMVMEKGLSHLPKYALQASIVGAAVGIVFELLLMARQKDSSGNLVLDEHGNTKSRFWWVPIPSAFGFALILPPSLTFSFAIGSLINAAWRKLDTSSVGTYALFAAAVAAGFVAGEAIMGGIIVPVWAVLQEL